MSLALAGGFFTTEPPRKHHTYLNHFAVYLKLTQHGTSTIFQKKKKKKKIGRGSVYSTAETTLKDM